MSQTSSDKTEKSQTDNVSAEKRSIQQRIPYRMLGKRLASTKRLVVSSKVWMKTIPTHNCDILLTFPSQADDSTLMWLLARLRSRTPQLVVHVRHHSNSGLYGFYMTATYENLLKGAEELGIKKHVKTEYGGGLKEFIFEEQDYFAGVEEEKSFLTSQERQSIVRMFLYELRAVDGEQLANIQFRGGQPIIPLLESKKVVSQVFPLHSEEDLAVLKKTWVQAIFKKQPLDDISNYFGVKIALYFAYLGHYTMALCIPAFLGVVLSFFEGDQNVADLSIVAFSLVNMLWVTIYLEHWKRTSAELSYRWGTLDKKDELMVDPRPLYEGDLVKSTVTGRLEPNYPAWKRQLFRYFVTIPVTSLSLTVVFVVMLLNFELQEWINFHVSQDGFYSVLRFIPKILLALSIGFLDDIYKKIALWLNDKENYRLEEHYANHLIIKLVLFQFVNSFLSLFYIAFYLQDMDRLRDQLAALLITRQVVCNLKEALLPYLIWKFKLLKVGLKITGQMSPTTIDKEMTEIKEEIKEMTIRRRIGRNSESDKTLSAEKVEEVSAEATGLLDGSKSEKVDGEKAEENKTSSSSSSSSLPTLTQAEVESAMQKYEDTYEDFLEMFIQFGYVILFSSAFPLAALCALLNNIIEIRTDAFKLCINHQRPFGKQVENIGIWQNALEVLGMIAVVVNCALIGITGLTQRMIPGIGDKSVLLILIVLEHLVLLLKFALAYAIPDVPEWVALEMAKIDFQRREALKRLESQNSPGLGSPDLRNRRIAENNGSQSGFNRSPPIERSQEVGFGQKQPTQTPPVPPPRRMEGIRPIRSSTHTLGLNPQRMPGYEERSHFCKSRSESPKAEHPIAETPRHEVHIKTELPKYDKYSPDEQFAVDSDKNRHRHVPCSNILSCENPSYSGVVDYNHRGQWKTSPPATAERDSKPSTNPFDPMYKQPESVTPVKPAKSFTQRRMSSPPVSPCVSDPACMQSNKYSSASPELLSRQSRSFENEDDRFYCSRHRRFSSDELNRRNLWERERTDVGGTEEIVSSSSSSSSASSSSSSATLVSANSGRIVFRGGNVGVAGSASSKKCQTQTFKKM